MKFPFEVGRDKAKVINVSPLGLRLQSGARNRRIYSYVNDARAEIGLMKAVTTITNRRAA
jgi:hypothetical protein